MIMMCSSNGRREISGPPAAAAASAAIASAAVAPPLSSTSSPWIPSSRQPRPGREPIVFLADLDGHDDDADSAPPPTAAVVGSAAADDADLAERRIFARKDFIRRSRSVYLPVLKACRTRYTRDDDSSQRLLALSVMLSGMGGRWCDLMVGPESRVKSRYYLSLSKAALVRQVQGLVKSWSRSRSRDQVVAGTGGHF
ncbi:uncharacterized protein B0I36DRAFT_324243 [Microdochium trichocladiopsis]|uniref:Uncharacterized protein n=1 Tax=Microdochium trichocladiopsis TaxID=1682393 RepID=A0A9P8Y7Y0_9PEZI|nr:uncharacterized protein B0I36DRAFT_324243 [Microdochium trichocladiopsis]KAH7031587.1 hypothetical protein B0I36DRAFT_324243 [Microdochium trichocladiopsis]